MILIKNADIFSPLPLGIKDVLIGQGKVLAIANKIQESEFAETIDLKGNKLLPGFIDQHMHVTGAGGKGGFASMTPELQISDILIHGTTTVVGLLGTDGSTRSIRSLYAKVKALEQEGMSAYMYTGYYGLDPVYLTETVQDDMIFIDKVLGCKIAISDIRSSYPTALELVRLLRQVRVGGMIASKKGILHIHLGNLDSKMDVLFELVNAHNFPIKHISPTHVGRTKALFDEAIEFAKLGGMIDITTGASKYDEPSESVRYAIEKGVSIDHITFSSDGNAGLTKFDNQGNEIGFRSAPVNENYNQVKEIITKNILPMEEAIKPITINPAINLGLLNKGRLAVGCDADLCVVDDEFNLISVFAMGKKVVEQGQMLIKGNFE